jgi:D-alanine-D-alanine ligase
MVVAAKPYGKISIIRSGDRTQSSMSLLSCNNIITVLEKHFDTVDVKTINTAADLLLMKIKSPGFAFMGMQSIRETAFTNERVWLADFLSSKHIKHTGSGKNASLLENNKYLAKAQVALCGGATARAIIITIDQDYVESDIDLTYPLFAKPNNRGGGLGIDDNSIIANFAALQRKVTSLRSEFGCEVLVEEFLDGREFSVAILRKEKSSSYDIMPLELIPPINQNGHRILSETVKTEDAETYVSVTDASLRTQLCELAMRSFRALGAKDYGRIDIRLDAGGVPRFLEANLLPSLLEDYGNFPKASKLNNGFSYEEIIMRIVNLGME